MLSQGGGVIVNTASVVGIRGGRRGAPYVAFKHGVVGLSKSAALEYALQNIRVNCVCPGEIDTAMNPLADAPPGAVEAVPMHRFGTPEDIAPAVLFCAAMAPLTLPAKTWWWTAASHAVSEAEESRWTLLTATHTLDTHHNFYVSTIMLW